MEETGTERLDDGTSPVRRDDARTLLNSVAAINAATISFLVLGAAYELLHVDIVAAIALFQYDDSMEASALAESVDLFMRLPMDSLHSYEALVPTNPVFYKACTSGLAYTIGDFVSQVYQGRTLETLDLKRSARSGAAGFFLSDLAGFTADDKRESLYRTLLQHGWPDGYDGYMRALNEPQSPRPAKGCQGWPYCSAASARRRTGPLTFEPVVMAAMIAHQVTQTRAASTLRK